MPCGRVAGIYILNYVTMQINKPKRFPSLVISNALLLFYVCLCVFAVFGPFHALTNTYTRRVLQYNNNNDLLT